VGSLLDLTVYVRVLDFLAQRQGSRGLPSWLAVTTEWADSHGLDEPAREYFLSGVTRLAGDPHAGGDWESRARDEELDRLVWTFWRAWVDTYGPLHPRGPGT
jgi:hypothetical protein